MRILLVISFIILVSVAQAQPGGYTPGDQVCWNTLPSGRVVGYFKAQGWHKDSANSHVLYFFAGDGQIDCDSYDGMSPTTLLRATSPGSDWDGKIVLNNGDTVRWLVISLMNYGNWPPDYATDIAYTIEDMDIDTAQHERIHVAGGSGGPGRALNYLNGTNHSSTYRTVFSTGIWMSCAFVSGSINSEYKVPYNYVWFGTADENGGTPPAQSYALHTALSGNTGFEKFIDSTVGGTHSNSTWSDCFATAGSNTIWHWMVEYGAKWDDPPVTFPRYLMDIKPAEVFDITGAAKRVDRLFDKDTAITSRVFQDNLNGYILDQTGGQVVWVVLDSFINHPRALFYKSYENGGGGNVTIQYFYDRTDTSRHSNVFTASLDNGIWAPADTANSRLYTDSTRLLRIVMSGASDKLTEAQIYGNPLASAPSILPTPAAEPPDPGKYFMSTNKVSTDTIMDDCVYDQRINMNTDYVDTTTIPPIDGKNIVFNRFSNTSISLTWLPNKRNGRRQHLYLANQRSGHKYPNQTDYSKDIPIGADSTDLNSWTALRNTYYALAGKLGSNPAVDYTGYSFSSTTPGLGLGLSDTFEIGNEFKGHWKGDLGFHRPLVGLNLIKAGFNGVKAACPNCFVISGALTGIDTMYMKGVYMENMLKYQTNVIPFDGIAINEYATNGGGQHQGVTTGITPGQFDLYNKERGFIALRDVFFPGKPVFLTEFGYDVHEGSGYRVKVIAGQTLQFTKGCWTMRGEEITAAARFSGYSQYTHKDGGGGDFSTTGIVRDLFCEQPPADTLPSYMHEFIDPSKLNSPEVWITVPNDLYWHMLLRAKLIPNYNAWPDIVRNGDSTGVWVLKYTHQTNADSLIYSIWSETDNNSSGTHVISIPGVTAAVEHHVSLGIKLGQTTTLTPGTNQITANYDESVQYIRVSVSSEPTPPH